MSEQPSRKKMSLLARRETLLSEIKYYEIKIEDARSVPNNNSFFDCDSSDSEYEFTIDTGLSITELKLNQRLLKTCLQATQELTSVTVLQSEVNVMVQDPVLERELPVREEGIWREVTAECRIDLVPFTISFHVHKPTRMFAPTSYRNLLVTPVKSSHEAELTKSVLSTVKRPSDVIEMIRNYSAAHRSRRSTLARLAEKYADTLVMEPMPEGGYMLKCAGVMEVQWTLQNKWSPLVPFHHRMVFDLEFMDESYIKLITQLHRQIIDPTLETDERTLLLAKIINTCIEAKSSIPEQYESTESESDTAKKLGNRRTTLDQEPEAPERKNKKDSEVMAPPKSLPKKSKSKGKENAVENKLKPVKRTADTKDDKNPKKSKLTESKISESKTNSNKSNLEKVTKKDQINGLDIQNKKAVEKTSKISDKITKKDTVIESKKSEAKPNTKKSYVDKLSKNVQQNDVDSEHPKKVAKKDKNKHTERMRNEQIKDKISDINVINHYKDSEKYNKNKSKIQPVKNIFTKKTDAVQNKDSTKINNDIKEKQNKKVSNRMETESSEEKWLLPANNITMLNTKQKKLDNYDNPETLKGKTHTENVNMENTTTKKISNENNKGSAKFQNKLNQPKIQEKPQTNSKDTENSIPKVPYLKNAKDVSKKPNTINYIKNQFLTKKPQALIKALSTKIPRKGLSSVTESNKKNVLRISPRKLSKHKSSTQDISKTSKSSQKSLQKVTNIPRLLKKPQTFKPKV